MATDATHVIIGAGLAGAGAAATLREEGFEGSIMLLGAEANRPYERPPLSKEYLQGSAGRDTIFVHPERWYTDHNVNLRLGVTATAVDTAAHEVALADGSRVGYTKLLLATGSSPRRLPAPGADLDGVHYLRTVEDSDRIRVILDAQARVVVIGASWIGLEVAAAARRAGASVTVLETDELPLLRVLGREMAAVFAGLHRRHGVDLQCGVQVTEIVGRGGRAHGMRLADGTVVEADAVIVGIGIVPTPTSPTPPASRSTTASASTSCCAAPTPTSTPPATSRAPSTRCSTGTSGSSTGQMPSTPDLPPPGPCSARTWRSTGCPTSSPTSTTSGWNTPATPNPTATIRSWSVATPTAGSSSPSGSPTAASGPA